MLLARRPQLQQQQQQSAYAPTPPQLFIALISCLYWFRCTAHCWQFDGGGPGALGPRPSPGYATLPPMLRPPRNTARVLARGPPPGNGGGRGFAALLGSQQQDVLYACPLNSMCQCAGLPNETNTLIEINCNEVALYKFPGQEKHNSNNNGQGP
ncbi:uncharacterized protein LOC115626577 [Scaptodrosophila lebanonensis]|uniref:Uncharacterized protein LOC115626577 n=1 Tax=Drosophila lebanonensis TaxID=7225 RepID=A0A6J2TRS5_DROLE|nr:uncharacterized protein LOC115626577 [Scaptodrosophila lebanonensis]